MRILLSVGALLIVAGIAAAGYKIGDEPADFKLKGIDGTPVSLLDYVNSRGVMVVFTSNNCPQSLWYEDRIIELARKISLMGWKTVAINSCSTDDGPDETAEGMQKRAEDKSYEFPYLRDENQAIAKAFGAQYVPTVFLLRATGTSFEVVYIGAIDDAADPAKKIHNRYVENAIGAMNAGVKPDTPMSKVAGCQMKKR